MTSGTRERSETMRRNTWIPMTVLLVTATMTARAQTGIGGVKSKGQVAAVAAGLVGGGVLIGIGVYYAIHHGHSLTGCAVSGPNGVQMRSEGDQQTYALGGDTAEIKSGERIRVSGNKGKKDAEV